MTVQQGGRDPLLHRVVNDAIAAGHRALGRTGRPDRIAVVLDPELDRQGRSIVVDEDQIRLSLDTWEALRRLHYVGGVRWTDLDPPRARRTSRALDDLHAMSLAAAAGQTGGTGCDVPTLTGHCLAAGVREAFRWRTRQEWLRDVGIDRAAPDIAALPCLAAYPTAGTAMHVLASYLAERNGIPLDEVLGALARAGDNLQERIAHYAMAGYDTALPAQVERLGATAREAAIRRIVAPMDGAVHARAWCTSTTDAPEARTRLNAVMAAVAVHHGVLEVAEEAGLRHGATHGTSLEREKAEYALRGAYVGWAVSSGTTRIAALARRAAARGAFVAILSRERGAAGVRLAARGAVSTARILGASAASMGERARRALITTGRPLAARMGQMHASSRSSRQARDAVRELVERGGFGF
jgi:hypothetical protein